MRRQTQADTDRSVQRHGKVPEELCRTHIPTSTRSLGLRGSDFHRRDGSSSCCSTRLIWLCQCERAEFTGLSTTSGCCLQAWPAIHENGVRRLRRWQAKQVAKQTSPCHFLPCVFVVGKSCSIQPSPPSTHTHRDTQTSFPHPQPRCSVNPQMHYFPWFHWETSGIYLF